MGHFKDKTRKDTVVVNSTLTGCHENVLCAPERCSGMDMCESWEANFNSP